MQREQSVRGMHEKSDESSHTDLCISKTHWPACRQEARLPVSGSCRHALAGMLARTGVFLKRTGCPDMEPYDESCARIINVDFDFNERMFWRAKKHQHEKPTQISSPEHQAILPCRMLHVACCKHHHNNSRVVALSSFDLCHN
jgi:hypothetical protein